MGRIVRGTIPVAVLTAFVASVPPEENRKAAVAAVATVNQPEATEIVFRGRFYMSRECRVGPEGEHALGLHSVCEVLDDLTGQLKLKRLIDVQLPKDAKLEETYTFRWRPSESTQMGLRKAEAGDYAGMWLGGELLEVVP
jgi:hypothetical protein